MKKLLVVLMLVTLGAAACGGSDDESGSESPPVSLSGTTNNHGTETAGDELAMELDDNYFGPTFVRAKAGQQIEIELENEGSNPHTFTSTVLGVDEEVPSGSKKTVTVTAPADGSAEFHCQFHRTAGMQGALFIG